MKPNSIKIVIAGGGFAGLNLSKELSRHQEYKITLVDKNNYHFFPPLLYQVASAFIEASNISYPFRRLFQKKENLRFHMGEVLRIDRENKIVETSTGSIPYDYFVIATGTRTNYFGIENIERNAWPMKTINDALNLRNHILLSMEKAVRAGNEDEKNKALTIVIAGGGPTGVEISGMLAEFGHYIAVKEYPEIQNLKGHIFLVDYGQSLLGSMSKKAQQESFKVLSRLGVHIKTGVGVKDYSGGIVQLSNGEQIPSDVLIWTSGVVANSIQGLPSDITGRGNRIITGPFNLVKDCKNIFAIGDVCIQTTDPAFPNGHPHLAQVAIQQGKLLAKNIRRIQSQKDPLPFRYKDKGSMAIISKYKAVADLPKFSLTGYFAWVIWLFIHIIPLVGYRNKAKLAFNWFWSFINNNPTLRLIIRPGKIRDSDTIESSELQ